VDSSVLAKVRKLDPQQRFVLADFRFLDFHNFLGLDNFADAVALQDEVWKIVPESALMDDDLDRGVNVASD
jgi:hypothetical protein